VAIWLVRLSSIFEYLLILTPHLLPAAFTLLDHEGANLLEGARMI
jgi:hypothetical protein